MGTITAVDITGHPELRGLWIPGYKVPGDLATRAGLAGGGVASPLGYWLVAYEGAVPAPSGGMRLVWTAPGEELPELEATPGSAGMAGRQYRTQTVRIKVPDSEPGAVVVTVGPGFAHVTASESAWTALAESITLVVCQIWRFQSIDTDLDRRTKEALENLHFANVPGLASLPQSRRLMDLGWETRAAIVDLTYFQKPLTDPLAYFDARRSARIYRLLADRFGLEEWCESIDHRAEVVEATFETITEKLYHLKSHAHDVVLEVVIVLILLIDIVMRIWELMA
jgi:hypothetical protein